MLKRLQFRPTEKEAGERLDRFLAAKLSEKFSEVSRSQTRALIAQGSVYLNRRRVRIASKPVFLKSTVEAFVDEKGVQGSKKPGVELGSPTILFEDEHFIAVDKPQGLPTQPTIDKARENVFTWVKRFLTEREGCQDAYLGLHHRLDRDTSGVLLFSKTKWANKPLAEMFKNREIEKEYLCLVDVTRYEGKLESGQELKVDNFLKPDPKSKKTKMIECRSGGKAAETSFVVEAAKAKSALVRAWPKTGRTHQIRVHLAGLGIPVLGDPVYGLSKNPEKNSENPDPNRNARCREGRQTPLRLHARRLTFRHPKSDNMVTVESSIPAGFVPR